MENKSIVVIGVFTDEIDASGRLDEQRLCSELFVELVFEVVDVGGQVEVEQQGPARRVDDGQRARRRAGARGPADEGGVPQFPLEGILTAISTAVP